MKTSPSLKIDPHYPVSGTNNSVSYIYIINLIGS